MTRRPLTGLRVAVAVGGLLAATLAHADAVFPAPSAALQCLTPQGAALKPLVYPKNAYLRREGDTVSVQLTFTEPDEGPDYKLLSDRDEIAQDLLDAVRRHVRQFRVPCLAPVGAPVVLYQDYVFIPNDGRKVVASKPRDEAMEPREGPPTPTCTVNGRDSLPSYPTSLEREGKQGIVFAELRFDAADKPPQVSIRAATHQRLGEAVTRAARGLRCKPEAAAVQYPQSKRIEYVFRVPGAPKRVLKDFLLADLIRNSQGFQAGVYFDTRTMGCPFDLRMTYYQPHWPNRVEQLETANPARQPLLDWLEQAQWRLPDDVNAELLAEQTDVHVPCMVIDL